MYDIHILENSTEETYQFSPNWSIDLGEFLSKSQ